MLWLLDGLLQAQPGMAAGLPVQVIEPTAVSSPHWVQHLVNWAGTTWSYHPVQAGSATVWIEVGIGLWLLAAPAGALSRLAGLVSLGWGLVVWVFGESFGGIFAPGLSWLTGAPGAALSTRGGRPARAAGPDLAPARPGRLSCWPGSGMFLAGMAVLQAWPGRGSGRAASTVGPGTLACHGPVAWQSRPSPAALAALVSGFGFAGPAHGFAVNLVAVIALARRRWRRRLDRPAADWPGPPWASLGRCAWPTGCWSRTSASSAAWAPTRTA